MDAKMQKQPEAKVGKGVVLKSGIWYTISNLCIRAMGIISTPIFTGLLTEGQMSYANTYNVWIVLINIFTSLCLVSSVGRAKTDFPEDYDAFVSSVQTLSTLSALICLGLAAVFLEPLSELMLYSGPLILLLFLYLPFSSSVDYMQNKCRFRYQYRQNIAISLISSVGTVAASVLFILLMPQNRPLGKIYGALLPTFVMGVFFYIKILRTGRTLYHKTYWLYALKISLPLIPHNLALNILGVMDRNMIRQMIGEEQNGIYSHGYSYGIILGVLTNAIGQAWQPWFFERMKDGKKEDRTAIREVNRLIIQLGCFLTIGFVVVGPEVVWLLGSGKAGYASAKWVIVPIILGTLSQYFYTNYVDIEIYHKKTMIIAVSSILAAALNFGLNLYYLPRLGYQAAAYTTLAGYLFLLLFHFLAVRFILKERLYDVRFRLALLTGTGILSFLFMALYDRFILRYAAAVIFTVVLAIIKKNDIIKLVQLLRNRMGRV